MKKGLFVASLTSGQSQWSKEACRKHLAAGLYLREANSARPEKPINKFRLTLYQTTLFPPKKGTHNYALQTKQLCVIMFSVRHPLLMAFRAVWSNSKRIYFIFFFRHDYQTANFQVMFKPNFRSYRVTLSSSQNIIRSYLQHILIW